MKMSSVIGSSDLRSVIDSRGLSSVAGKFNEAKTPGTFLKWTVFALVFCSVALPTGTIVGIPLKHLAYVACMCGLIGRWCHPSSKLDVRLVWMFFLVSAFVAFYLFIGAINPLIKFGYVLNEGIAFFSAITIVLIALAARSLGAVSDEELASYIFYGAFVFAIWKVLVVLALVSGVVDFPDVYSFLVKYVGYRPVTSGIFGGLVRFNLIIYDFIVAVLLFFVPAFPKSFSLVPGWVRRVFLLIGFACLVFAFSRLLFGLVAVLWAYLFVFKMRAVSKLVAAVVIVVAISMSMAWIVGAFEQRFNDLHSSRSDDIRSEQIEALLDQWVDAPLIGGGFGSYAPGYVRDPSAPFSYEVQWVGFLAKLGALGVLFLISLVFCLFGIVYKSSGGLDGLVVGFVLAIFILGGFTNQYLVSSASGVFYSLVLVLSFLIDKQRRMLSA